MHTIQNPIPDVVYQSDERAAYYLENGAWTNSTVGDCLRQSAKRHPERHAFISDERSIDFKTLDAETERLGAALLNLGLNPGDRAIFQLGTTVETVVAVTACYKAGIIPVCAIPQYREVEISALSEKSQARAHFVQADFSSQFDLVEFADNQRKKSASMEHIVVVRGSQHDPLNKTQNITALINSITLEEARQRLADVPVSPRDLLSFQLSGGSTGLPKIIPRFHAEYLGHSANWAAHYGVDRDSRVIWSLPIMHNAGQLYALIPPLQLGITTVLMPKVDIKRMLELIELHQVTHGISIGPIAPQLIAYTDQAQHDLSSMKLFATMSRADSLEAHIGIPCSNLYGITEGLLMGCGAAAPAAARHQTQGRSVCSLDEFKLLEPETDTPVAPGTMGEFCFRGPSSLLGYYADPDATERTLTKDGFVRTGDMMTEHIIDGKSYFAFEGRLRDNINRGGEKIGCEEVEAFISRHPAIADAKLVAMPDPIYIERGCAFLIIRPGQKAPDVKSLADFLIAQGLAKYKCPERIELVSEFPITRVGKVDKAVLRAQISALLQKEQSTVQAQTT